MTDAKLDHQDFNSAGKFAAWGYFRGERLVNNTDIDAQPGEMYKSGSNHGTSCAGVIAGEADAVLTSWRRARLPFVADSVGIRWTVPNDRRFETADRAQFCRRTKWMSCPTHGAAPRPRSGRLRLSPA